MKYSDYYNIMYSIKCFTFEIMTSIYYYAKHSIDKIIHTPSQGLEDNDIVFFCGYGNIPGNKLWDDVFPLETPVNIVGGSESCIINLAESFAIKNNVTVYCYCRDDFTINNVKYINSKKFNYNISYKNIILWRVQFVQYFIKSSNIILWIHDGSYIPILDYFYKIKVLHWFIDPKLKIVVPSIYIYDIFNKYRIYKSLFHIRHGIEKSDIISNRIPNSFLRHPILNRGLDILLENFHHINKLFPDAMIHICGNINNYHKNNNSIYNIIKKYNKNIIFHGLITKSKILELITKCDLFCYPGNIIEAFSLCTWESALGGCIPIVYDIGALSEINSVGGIVVENKNINLLIKTIIDVLSNLDNKEKLRKQIQNNIIDHDWNSITYIWYKDIII